MGETGRAKAWPPMEQDDLLPLTLPSTLLCIARGLCLACGSRFVHLVSSCLPGIRLYDENHTVCSLLLALCCIEEIN